MKLEMFIVTETMIKSLLSDILKNTKENVSQTGSFSTFSWGAGDLFSVGFIMKS
jgi:hypothetical protein